MANLHLVDSKFNHIEVILALVQFEVSLIQSVNSNIVVNISNISKLFIEVPCY